MCNCIAKMDKALDEAGHNTVVGTLLLFSQKDTEGGKQSAIRQVAALVSNVKEKKRGAKAVTLTPTHCPFCGEKYDL